MTMNKYEAGKCYRIEQISMPDKPLYAKVKSVEETIEGRFIHFHLLYTKVEGITTNFSLLEKHITPQHGIRVTEVDISEVTLAMLED